MDIHLPELSDNRLMCLLMGICEKLYYHAAMDEEGKAVDKDEVLRHARMYKAVREEVVDRGLLDNAFNLN